jgi:H+/Cl- antiporter ClcA
MRSIRYSLHFSLLIGAIFIFWLARDVHFPAWISNFNSFHYGLMGVLYATALVVSLRDRKANDPIIALCFIALAAVWSAATPILGLWGSIVWSWIPLPEISRPSDLGFVLIFVTGSAIGAAGYWLLVRLFWLKSLRRGDCLRTVALCVAATVLSYAVVEVLPQGLDRTHSADITDLILTIAWWFAFSISLYWSEMSGQAKKSPEAMVSAGFNS